MAAIVEFLPGDGSTHQIEIAYVASDFARNANGVCAFCEGDPCAELPEAPKRIRDYMAGGSWRECCPFCEGRPS